MIQPSNCCRLLCHFECQCFLVNIFGTTINLFQVVVPRWEPSAFLSTSWHNHQIVAGCCATLRAQRFPLNFMAQPSNCCRLLCHVECPVRMPAQLSGHHTAPAQDASNSNHFVHYGSNCIIDTWTSSSSSAQSFAETAKNHGQPDRGIGGRYWEWVRLFNIQCCISR